MEENVPSKQKKEGRYSHTYIRQIDFKTKRVTRDREGHYVMTKGPLRQEDIYAPNTRAPKYITQILADLMGEIDNTIIVGKSSTPLPAKH